MPFNWFGLKKSKKADSAPTGPDEVAEPSDVGSSAAAPTAGTPSKAKGAAKSTGSKSAAKAAPKQAPAKKSNQGKKTASKKR